MLDQLVHARADAAIRLAHAGVEVGVHRGRIAVHAPPPPAFDVAWRGEHEIALPHGTVRFTATTGAGIDAARLATAPVRVRSRAGGERLQLARQPPAAGAQVASCTTRPCRRGSARRYPSSTAATRSRRWPGFAVDAQFAAATGAPGIAISWHPTAR